MNLPVALMLLVSCDDSYQSCHVLHDAVQNYEKKSSCENSLKNKIISLSQHGQQIFGKCVDLKTKNLSVRLDEKVKKSSHSTPKLHWNVTKNGDLYTKILYKDL